MIAPVWSHDGAHLLLLGSADETTLSVVDSATATVTASLEADGYSTPGWNRNDTEIAFAQLNNINGDNLFVYDFSTQQQTLLAEKPEYLGAVAWSPARDNRFAAIYDNEIDIVSALDGTSVLPQPYPNGNYWYNLTWTPTGIPFR